MTKLPLISSFCAVTAAKNQGDRTAKKRRFPRCWSMLTLIESGLAVAMNSKFHLADIHSPMAIWPLKVIAVFRILR